MAMLSRKQVILAKVETTYGSDVSPAAADDAILALNPTINEVVEPIERNIHISTLSNKPALEGTKHYELNFQVEVKGSGTEGTAPRLGALLQACSMSEAIVSNTSVTYKPESSDQDSATIYLYHDGRRYILTGARGTVKLTMAANALPLLDFTFKGMYNAPTATAIVTGTYDSTDPVTCKNGTFSYNSKTTLITSEMNIDLANNVIVRHSMSASGGIEGFEITSRKPVADFLTENQIQTSYDFRGDRLTNTREISYVIGSTAGNICTVTVPKFNINTIERVDVDGISKERLSGDCAVDSADDEIEIAFT